MPHKTVYRINTFGDVTGPLAASGKAIMPCTVVWDNGPGFNCKDEEDIKVIILAVAKEKGFYFEPQHVIDYLLRPTMTATEVRTGLRQTSLTPDWVAW